jgi:PAS domain S-box-containing protein
MPEEREGANRTLRQQYSMLEAIINSSDSPIFSVDRQYRYTSFNKAHAAVMKAIYDKDIEIGKSLLEYMTVAEDREEAKRNLDRALAGDHVVEEAYSGDETRSRLYFEVSHSPIIEEDGAVIGVVVFARDITERKKAGEALRESEERYRLLIEKQKDGLCIVDLEERFVFCNPAGEEVFGVPHGNLVGRNVREFTTPETFEFMRKQTEKRRSGESGSYEIEITRPDGEKRQLLTTATPWLDKDGRIVGALAVFRDETNRKRAERDARRQADLLQKTFNSMTDAIFILDAASPSSAPKILECNEAASSVFGYLKAEMLGRSTDFLHVSKETLKQFQSQLYPAVAEGGLPFHLPEFRMRRKDGSVFLSEHMVTQLLNEKGERTGWISIVRDITERKRAEEELRENEKRFRHVSSVISDIAYSCTRGPDGNYLIDWMIGATEHITGYSVEEIKAQGCWRFLVLDEDLPLFEKRVTGLAPGSAGFCELRLRHKSGDIVWVESSAECATEPGNPEGLRLYGGLVDITERNQAAEALGESEEKYRRLFEEAMDGIALADPDTGILLDCNQALAALVGRNRAELIGQHQTILHPPSSDDNEFSPTFKLHATTREGQVLETQVITATGEIREVEIKASLLYLRGRRMLQGIFSDVTERKQAEDALRRRAEELAALQATVLDITGHQDVSVLLQAIVERAARLLGARAGGMYLCDPEKQEARCVVSYNTPHDYAGTVLKYGEGAAGIVAQTGQPLIIDDYRSWQGRATVFEEKQPFRAVLTLPMTWQGRVTGVIHVLDDTASRHFTRADQELLKLFANHAAIAVENTRLLEQEKHHAEELARYSTNLERLVLERTRKLAESERRFRELANLLPQIVFEIDERGKLQFMNQAAFAATGCTEEEFCVGLNAFDLFAPEDHERARGGIRRIMTGETLGGREFTVLRRDGTSFPALVYTAPITRGGKTVGLRGIAMDITQRKRAEEELRSARERLEHIITSNPAVIITGKPRPTYPTMT